jgi:NHLM bacteriocin system ABC transporter ATP-binding protein
MTDLEPTTESTSPLELFLLQLRYREGRSIVVEGNKPLLLDDPNLVWVVYSGQVDVFSIPVRDTQVAGARKHLFRVLGGHLLFGIQPDQDSGLNLLASGTPGTNLIQIERTRFQEMVADPESREFMARMVADWVLLLSSCATLSVPPKDLTLLAKNSQVGLDDSVSIVARQDLVWVRSESGMLHFMDRPELEWGDAKVYLPLSRFMWARAFEPVLLSTLDTQNYFQTDPTWQGISEFHRLVMTALSWQNQQELTTERTRFEKLARVEQKEIEGALANLKSSLTDDGIAVGLSAVVGDNHNSLVATCRLVATHLGVEINVPHDLGHVESVHAQLNRIAKASGLRIRAVRLNGGWYQHSLGALLGFVEAEADEQPVALLPRQDGGYSCHDTLTMDQEAVGSQQAAQLSALAYVFYRPLPAGEITARDLLKYALTDISDEVRSISMLGLAIGLLGLLPPLATSLIFDRLLPGADRPGLFQVGLALILVAIVLGIFHYAREISTLRVEGKVDYGLQAAIWDRLLSLPATFFRQFSAGDLGSRAMSVSLIRQLLSGQVITAVFNSIFSIPVLILLFFYSFKLGLFALGLVFLGVLGTLLTAYFQLRFQRQLADIQSCVSGLVLQLITGISKFRVAGAEHRAFALWAESFAIQKRLYYKSRRLANSFITFNAAFPVWAALTIFLMVTFSNEAPISTGEFLAFNLAFTQFISAGIILSMTILSVTSIIPLYEQARPIFETLPEADETKADPGELSGKIEVSHLSFRYADSLPQVLNDVSLTIEPGEFVAIVGSSGSGKSTLFRLLIGFEHVEAGGVYYDGQDLAELDLRSVRQQLGVVLQHAQPMMGDIFTNIVGSFPHLTQDDAWDAARLVGLEKDIRAMPMGMHTIVTHGGGTFSGGQIQRLLIARALANKPRILFLDEATSSLDNQTQAHVRESLAGIAATRVVIAHRLSTIEEADRIYVFDEGQIVQQGSYAELMRQRGPFAELAKRQMA